LASNGFLRCSTAQAILASLLAKATTVTVMVARTTQYTLFVLLPTSKGVSSVRLILTRGHKSLFFAPILMYAADTLLCLLPMRQQGLK
jgi:hypothetical protein